MKLTTEYLESKGFYGKYKSCHKRWCKNGLCIDQASDEDDYGGKIDEKDDFTYNWSIDINTVKELDDLYFEKTGEHL